MTATTRARFTPTRLLWLDMALATAVLSGDLILLCWGGINTSSALFALVFDIAVVGYALWQGRAVASFGG